MATKQHTAQQAGPVTFDARLNSGSIRVTVDIRSHAEITITTTDNTGPSADAVNNTAISDHGDRITADVRSSGGGSVMQVGGGTVQINSGSGIFVAGNMVGGSVIASGGDIIINGVRIGGGGASVVVGGSPILIEAKLPAGSSLITDTTSASVDVTGVLARAQVRSVSGDINLDGVASLDGATTSGDIRVQAFAGSGQVRTVSGDVRVHAAQESSLSARTVSGDVEVRGARVALDASTVSGRVSQR